jgi:hypothetical protein
MSWKVYGTYKDYAELSEVVESWVYVDTTPAYGRVYHDRLLDAVVNIYRTKGVVYYGSCYEGNYASAFTDNKVIYK